MTAPTSGDSRATNVLVISHVANVWGAQRRLLDLAPLLREERIVLTMASPIGELSDRWQAAGLPHQELDLPEHHGVRGGDGRRPSGPALARELTAVARSSAVIARRARRFDLVQSHSLWAHLETAAAGRLARRPVVLDLHDIVSPGTGRRVLGLAARLATLTVANSAATAATLPTAHASTVIVHPGVDLDRFQPGPADPVLRAELTSDAGAPLVAIIGRVDPNKGVEVVVEALARTTATPPPHLVVIGREQIGDRAHLESLRSRARELLGTRVRFLGPRDDVPAVLRSVDVLVNASRHEPFGRTVLEAQASGTPVVGTDAGGIPEFVADGETGLLVPPFEADALATALARLLGDDALRSRLVTQGVEQARTRFGLRTQAGAMAAAYRRALET